jgi:hypothetical protein
MKVIVTGTQGKTDGEELDISSGVGLCGSKLTHYRHIR